MQTTTLAVSIRHVLVATAGIVGLAGGADARAQQQAETATLDRIEVTGSRIRQVDLERAAPVLTITRADIEKQGFQSVADILQNVSAAGAPGISRAQPLLAGENVGGQFIDLRNLGPTRTLVLVNGKRLGISTTGLQDVSLIPTAAVERIEVLKDGASSIYGSDAIAGVINIITRSDYEGARAQAYYGQYGEGDGAITRADLVMGFTGDRGSLTAALEYRKENEVMARDRPFSAYPQGQWHPTRDWTTVSQWGVINLPASLGGNRVLDAGADWRRIGNYHAQDGNTGTSATATDPTGSTVDKSNANQQIQLRTPLESRSMFVDGSYDISDTVRFRGNALYSQRDARRQVAGYPFQSAVFRTPMSVDSYYNPVGAQHGYAAPRAVDFWRRTWEIPRVDQATSTTWRLGAGLEGGFEVGSRFFDWDVGYLYSNNRVTQANYGNLNVARVAQAVGPSFLNAQGQVQCGTAANPIALAACVPWNPFIPYGRVGDGGLSGNDALTGFLFQTLNSTGETETQVLSANLAGSLLALPAGDLGFAVGVETRKESGEFTPDAMAVTGNSTTLSSGPTEGSYSVDEVYAELEIPLLADLPGARELALSLASRYSDYDTFGDTVNSKAGFRWKPVDSLMLRGTWAEGFRAPTIGDLFGGGSQTFPNFTDPCDTNFGSSATNATTRANCVAAMGALGNTYRQLGQGFTPVGSGNAQTPVAFFSGSNDALVPETSVSRTLGVVWSPGFVEGLNVSLDWWEIRLEDTIVPDSPTQLLNDCYIQSDARCTQFTRDPVLGYVNTLDFYNINAGYRETEGYDLDLGYRVETGTLGAFDLTWQTTYTVRDEVKTDTNLATLPQQLVGYATSPGFLGTFRIRSNASLTWTYGSFGATWGARYYSSQKETCLSAVFFPDECSDPDFRAANPAQTRPLNRAGSITFNDLEVRWDAPWQATVALGAINLFDRIGPQFYSQPSANVRYHGQYDIGRFVYMKYQQKF